VDLNFKKQFILKSVWFWLFIALIASQFISMNISAKIESNPKEEIQAPKEVMTILKRSCYDCHSSDVHEPFYYNIAPMSWLVQLHVKNGRKVVNFSKWQTYSIEKQLKVIDKLPKSIVIRMPMPSYLWLHQDATMSANEKKSLTKWAEELKEKIK
jgi:cbb3-type cytochrome oxidase cytochrome c subunit